MPVVDFICNNCGHEFSLTDWDYCPECNSDDVDEVELDEFNVSSYLG